MAEKKVKDPRKLRNLKQYADLTDEEFAKEMGILLESDDLDSYEERVEAKFKEFENDYDLSDMKFNDTELLRALCRAIVTLEDYDNIIVNLRDKGMGGFNLTVIEKISKVMSDLRKDISVMQNDLGISRKTRKDTAEDSARAELDRQKELAKKFYEKVMQYIYCEKCHMLLSTAWFLYPDSSNSISLKCKRKYYDDDGNIIGECGHVTKITSKKLLEKRGTNHPEGFKY